MKQADYRDNQAFQQDVLSGITLDAVLDFIRARLEPGDVFPEDVLFQHAREVIDDGKVDESVKARAAEAFDPEDVFSTERLQAWAEANANFDN